MVKEKGVGERFKIHKILFNSIRALKFSPYLVSELLKYVVYNGSYRRCSIHTAEVQQAILFLVVTVCSKENVDFERLVGTVDFNSSRSDSILIS